MVNDLFFVVDNLKYVSLLKTVYIMLVQMKKLFLLEYFVYF